MFDKASLRHPKPSGSHRRLPTRPVVEELEPRLTPAEVGLNDFRLSFMGPDGNINFAAISPAVAYNNLDNEYLIVWSGPDLVSGEVEVYGQRLNAATGTLVGVEIRISDMGPEGNILFGAFAPAVAYNGVNNEYLVVWTGDDGTAPLVDNEHEVFGQRLSTNGSHVGANDFRISDMGPDGNANFEVRSPAVAYNGVSQEYLVVWSGDDDTLPLVDNEFEIFGQRLNAVTGNSINAQFRLSDMGPEGNANFDAFAPAVAYNSVNNEYLVVWHGQDNTSPLVDNESEIFGQRLTGTGAHVGDNDFRLSDVGPDGNTAFGAFAPAVAYNSVNNEYLVVWEADDNTAPLVDDEFEIFGQRLTGTGAHVGGNDFRLSDMGPDGNTNFDASTPAVAYSSVANEYLVVWYGEDDIAPLTSDDREIFGQRLNAATGAHVGGNDFRLSDMGPDGNTNFDAFDPAVAYNGVHNEYLVVWSGDDNTLPLVDNETEIFGQRFAPVDPPPPPLPPPPPQIVTSAFKQKGKSKVRVKDAATGALRAVLTPFRGFAGRLRLQLVDVTGDGSLDLIVKAVINGKRKKKVFDAVTLAPLPPGRA